MRVFHFMRYKWWFVGTLSAVTLFAIIAIFVIGLDLGIDFRGGVRLQTAVERTATVEDVRTIVSNAGVKEPIVQSVSGPTGTHSFMITAQEMSDAEQQAILATLDKEFGLVENSTSVETVGASFGEETTKRAFLAVGIAMIAIIAYLSFRFEFKFALPAIVALIHDLGLTLGIYAADHRLVTSATVAAILTILGYSVHDTIVVLDRMRENTALMKKETYGDMADLSIRQTMVRSINTSVCVLLPLVAILIFGGPTLKDFAFALTIGTITGTYSSFFVAVPLAVIWKEREPKYRKRLVAASAAPAAAAVDNVVAGDQALRVEQGEPVLATVSSKSAGTPAGVTGTAPSAGTSRASAPKPGGVSHKPKKGKTSKRPAGKGAKRTSR